MSDKIGRVDWSETDLLMEQLRQKLAEDEGVESAEPPLDNGASTDVFPISATKAEKSDAAVAAPTVEESAKTVENTPLTESKNEGEPVSKQRNAAAQRRKRKRIPKLSEIENQGEIKPLVNARKEALLQRKKELAAQDDGDIYWQVEGGKTTVPVPPRQEKAKKEDRPSRATARPRVAFDSMPSLSEPVPIKQEKAAESRSIEKTGESLIDERFADLTVEGLIRDIFGSAMGESTPALQNELQHTGVEGGKKENKIASRVVTDSGVQAEDAAPCEPFSLGSEALENENAVKLELGGERLVLPVDIAAESDATSIPSVREGAVVREEESVKNPADSDLVGERLFAGVSVKRMPKDGVLPKPSIAKMSADQLALKRSLDESEEDFRLLLDLDYEEELGRAIGFEKIQEYQERHVNGNIREASVKRPSRKKHFEYGSHAQDINISKIYTKRRRRAILNFTVSLLAMLLLFAFESKTFLHVAFGIPDANAPYPVLYLLLCIFVFAVPLVMLRKKLIFGIVALFRLSPVDYSFCSVAVLVTLCYHALLFFLPVSAGLLVFLSPAAASLVLLSLANLLSCYREQAAFRVVSSKQQKYALLSRVSVGGVRGNAALRLQQTEREAPILFARPVEFVRKYFTNTERKANYSHAMGSLLLLVTAFAALIGICAPVFGATAALSLHMAFVSFLVMLPVLSGLITAMPMFFASHHSLCRKAAIVGEVPVYAAADGAELVLSADAFFAPMRHEQFELVMGCDPVRSRALIRALLERIESPLMYSVEASPESRVLPASVRLTDVSEDGVAAVVTEEKKTTMLLGSVKYLQKYGIRVSPKSEERYGELCRHMLCVAVNNKLTALFIAKYRLLPEVSALVEALAREGLSLTVRTMDPGIQPALMEQLCTDLPIVIGVQKPLATESDIRTERVDATVVALGSAREAARAYAVCHRIRRAVRLGKTLQILSVLAGAVVSVGLFFFGRLQGLAPFTVALLSLFWSSMFASVSYLFLQDRQE